MKRILTALIMCLPMVALAQNDWEVPDEPKPVVTVNPDEKYLAGAVPVVNGRVVFQHTIEAPGLSAGQIYDKLLNLVGRMTKGKNQFEQSRIVFTDSTKHSFAAYFQEWLVFTNRALVLDRTRLMYNLVVECADGSATIYMQGIKYLYEEERDPQRYTAEEWITDENALNKKKTKLSPLSGKFRRKTIDRKDFIFSRLEEELK